MFAQTSRQLYLDDQLRRREGDQTLLAVALSPHQTKGGIWGWAVAYMDCLLYRNALYCKTVQDRTMVLYCPSPLTV